MAKEKEHINLVFIGHVDHGKSTTVGRLMYDSGNLPEQELAKYKEEAQKHGKVGFEFAYFMDRFREERERGVTIDLSYQKLPTQKFEVTIIDAPGHRDFVKNMITGASQADAAFLVIAAPAGVQPQTTEHLWLLRTAGVKHISIAINKMDLEGANPDKVKRQLAENEIAVEGYGGDVVAVEVSATKGTGIDELLEVINLISEMN